MALNGNYIFEDLGDVKCSIVEKNCDANRVNFLKELMEFNGFTVVVVPSPPPKVAPKPAPVEGAVPEITPALPETFTVGVTDLTFNPINGVYNRQLKTPEGKFVSVNYWKQRESSSRDDVWYWKG